MTLHDSNALPIAIILKDGKREYFVVREWVEYYEDKTHSQTFDEVLQKNNFKRNDKEVKDFVNTNRSSAYWLKFLVVNASTSNSSYRLELYDYDIDEISLFIKDDQGNYPEKKSGYTEPFLSRGLAHKNIGFDLQLQQSDTAIVYLRLFSRKLNIFEPVIKASNYFYEYSLGEYMTLGIFYGLMLLIILYNIVYYLILRINHYFYYAIYVLGVLVYLMGNNGTGFQYLWPDYPIVNTYIGTLSFSVSLISILLFTNNYLELSTRNKKLQKVIYFTILLKLILLFPELFFQPNFVFKVLNLILIQVAFVAIIIQYRAGYNTLKWYIIAFVFLKVAFLVTWLEQSAYIPSNIYSIYALNAGVILQFIFLSISIAESIKHNYEEKNKALTDLILAIEKNESLRIQELKKQMNPHFIFNALNSILHRILSGKKEEAAQFLTSFSKLIRIILNSSDKNFVPLSEEIESLELYLSLEKMRLGNSFVYSIHIDKDIDAIDSAIPSLIIQPFVENAIWHGLMPKEGDKNLTISISFLNKKLAIDITDNGIGRVRSATLKDQDCHKSKGIDMISERLALIQLKYKREAVFSYIDLYDINNQAIGTKVILQIEI